MTRARIFAIAMGAGLLLAGCASGGGYYGGAYYGQPYYDAYYDGFYGPFNGGYWGPDGLSFYYYDGRGYRRDRGHHFVHTPQSGYRYYHWRGREQGRGDRDRDRR